MSILKTLKISKVNVDDKQKHDIIEIRIRAKLRDVWIRRQNTSEVECEVNVYIVNKIHLGSLVYFLLVYAKISLWHCGGVVTQRSAKPCTPVQFRSVPPIYRSRCGEFFRKSHDFGSIISLSPNGGIGIRVRLKIEWRNPYGFKSHFGHQPFKTSLLERFFIYVLFWSPHRRFCYLFILIMLKLS